jgi:hypothetical protein
MRMFSIVTCMIFAAACAEEDTGGLPAQELIVAAVEGDGSVVVLDGESGQLIRSVDLAQPLAGDHSEDERVVAFTVHNVQGAPDGRTAWVTALPRGSHDEEESMQEQLIGVDTSTLVVRERIELGADLHVAHVVIAGQRAFVTAYESDAVLVVDLEQGRVERDIALPPGTGPHGLRATPDGEKLVIAGMGDGSMHVVEVVAGEVISFALPGRAVQAAVLPDGQSALVTIYDTRQVARLDMTTRELVLFDLPPSAAGPVQLYPTPDGQSVWIADQGMLDDQPAGKKLYRMNTATGAIDLDADVSPGPHGVVLDRRGQKVWITTLEQGFVQAIDARTGEVLSTTTVGNAPNGITCVFQGGAMP